jgi:hypothetical protein
MEVLFGKERNQAPALDLAGALKERDSSVFDGELSL